MTREKIMSVFDVLVEYLLQEEAVVLPKAKLKEEIGDLTVAEIDAIVNTLQLNELIKLKYVDSDVYCMGILPAGIREKEKRDAEKKAEEERLKRLQEEEEKRRLEEEKARQADETHVEGQNEQLVSEENQQPQEETEEKAEEYYTFSKKGVMRFMIALGLVVFIAIFLSVLAVSLVLSARG